MDGTQLEFFCLSLPPRSALRALDLSHQRLDALSLAELAAAVRRGALPWLRELSVAYNPLGDEGGDAVAALLLAAAGSGSKAQLQRVDFTSCFLGDKTAAAIVGALGQRRAAPLAALRLGANPEIGPTQRSALRDEWGARSGAELVLEPGHDAPMGDLWLKPQPEKLVYI